MMIGKKFGHGVLFFDNDKKLRKEAFRIISSTGVRCHIPDNMEQLKEDFNAGDWSLIILDFPTHRDLNENNFDFGNQNVVILSKEKLKTIYSYLLHLPTFSNFVAKNKAGGFDADDLFITVVKLIHNNFFGLNKYLRWGSSNMIFHVRDSARRNDYLNLIDDYCKDMKLRVPIVDAVHLFCEELLTNALYDAPRDKEGNERYITTPRSERVVLSPVEAARIEVACDGRRLGVSISDPFGGLSRDIVLTYLTRCFQSTDGSKFGPEQKGGAGLGLYLSFNSVSQMIINVDPHIKTELIGLIDINLSVKEFKIQNKSFNFFCKNSKNF